MKIVATGKHLDLGDAFRTYIAERLDAVVGKYFDNAIEAHVVLSRDAHLYRAECAVHVGSGISMQAQGEAEDIHKSFDMAADRLEKQLRRDKRRRRKHKPGTTRTAGAD